MAMPRVCETKIQPYLSQYTLRSILYYRNSGLQVRTPSRCAFEESVSRAMNWDIEAPNVVTEARFRELVESGHRAEILCQDSAHKKGPSYYGTWIMRTVSDDGVEKLLVTARSRSSFNDIKIREFKTITGVVSFLIGIGFTHADVPLLEGQRSLHKLTEADEGGNR